MKQRLLEVYEDKSGRQGYGSNPDAYVYVKKQYIATGREAGSKWRTYICT